MLGQAVRRGGENTLRLGDARLIDRRGPAASVFGLKFLLRNRRAHRAEAGGRIIEYGNAGLAQRLQRRRDGVPPGPERHDRLGRCRRHRDDVLRGLFGELAGRLAENQGIDARIGQQQLQDVFDHPPGLLRHHVPGDVERIVSIAETGLQFANPGRGFGLQV